MTAEQVDLKGGFEIDESFESSLAQELNCDQQEKEKVSEYDFVEKPDQDYFCPVSLELLTEPKQTSCCGNHISEQAANRLMRDKKPCPTCKEEYFTVQADKYFRRKVHQLKVRCPHKENGCEWTGELGNGNYHSSSCPKRPWKCQYCHVESTFDVGTNEHTPNCGQYPLPCPNQCEIVTVLRCDAENHLLVCPLQLVDCEFASAGCEVKVPRRDLARHMTENTQQHLMSATLLNLRLTRELHQKMEEKDQQIAELKQQISSLDTKLSRESKSLGSEQARHGEQGRARPPPQRQQFPRENPASWRPARHQQRSESSPAGRRPSPPSFSRGLEGATTRFLTLEEFSKQQAKGGSGRWNSDVIQCRGHLFKLEIETNGFGDAKNNHLSAYLRQEPSKNDASLHWPVRVEVRLELLDQQSSNQHQQVTGRVTFKNPTFRGSSEMIGGSTRSFPLAKLAHNASTGTEYLRDDCLKFKMSIKIIE